MIVDVLWRLGPFAACHSVSSTFLHRCREANAHRSNFNGGDRLPVLGISKFKTQDDTRNHWCDSLLRHKDTVNAMVQYPNIPLASVRTGKSTSLCGDHWITGGKTRQRVNFVSRCLKIEFRFAHFCTSSFHFWWTARLVPTARNWRAHHRISPNYAGTCMWSCCHNLTDRTPKNHEVSFYPHHMALPVLSSVSETNLSESLSRGTQRQVVQSWSNRVQSIVRFVSAYIVSELAGCFSAPAVSILLQDLPVVHVGPTSDEEIDTLVKQATRRRWPKKSWFIMSNDLKMIWNS
jgi:hypothetical protein